MRSVRLQSLFHGMILSLILLASLALSFIILIGILLFSTESFLSSPTRMTFILHHFFGLKMEYRHYQKTQQGMETHIQIEGLEVDREPSKKDERSEKILSLERVDIALNMGASLLHLSPVFDHFYLSQGKLNFPSSGEVSAHLSSKILGYGLKMLNFGSDIQISHVDFDHFHVLNFYWKTSVPLAHQFSFNADLPNVSGNLTIQGKVSGNLSALNTLKLAMAVKVTTPELSEFWLDMDQKAEGTQEDLFATSLNLSAFSWLCSWLPKSIFPLWLESLNLRGQVSNLKFSGLWSAGNLKTYETSAEFLGLGFHAFQNIPGVSDLNGSFQANTLGGTLKLSSQKLVVSAPTWFASDWPEMNFSSDLHWKSHPQKAFSLSSSPWIEIFMDSLSAKTANLDLEAHAHWDIPRREILSSKLEILSTLKGENLTQASINPYLPKPVFHPVLYEWLSHNIRLVASLKNTFQFSGKLNEFPFSHSEGVLQDSAEIQGGSLIPWPDWPEFKNIEGSLFFDRSFFAAEVKDAQVFSSHVGPIHMEVPDFAPGHPSDFVIHGEGSVLGEDLGDYIVQSPLKYDLPLFEHLKVLGKLELKLFLDFPLGKKDEEANQIRGSLDFDQNQLKFKETPLSMKHFTGKIHFDGFHLSADSPLTGTVLDEPWRITVDPERFELSGNFDFSNLAQTIENPLLKKLSGKAPVSLKIDLRQALNVEFRTYLREVELDLPPPLFKPKGIPFPLKITVNECLGDSSHRRFEGNFSLGFLLNGKYEWSAEGLSLYALFHRSWLRSLEDPMPWTPRISDYPSLLDSPLKQKIVIQGDLFRLDLGEWLMTLNSALPSSVMQNRSVFPLHTRLDLSVDALQFFSQDYSHVHWGLSAEKNQAPTMEFLGHFLRGTLVLDQPIQARFEVLGLKNSNLKSLPLLPDRLKAFPSLWLEIKNLYWNGEKTGSLRFFTFPLDDGIELQNGHFDLPTMSMNFSGTYLTNKAKPTFKAQIEVYGTDFSRALGQLGFPSKLKKTKGAVVLEGEWQGTPTSLDVSTLNGTLGLNLQDGTLMDIDNPAISRLLGLFSIETLGKHLSLNFSDMKEKGFLFTEISGVYSVKSGVASTSDLLINGPTLRADLSGQINLVNKTMDQTVVALPNLGGGVALAAGLIGGPVLGVLAWVTNKVLMDTVLKNRGVVYQLKEQWK